MCVCVWLGLESNSMPKYTYMVMQKLAVAHTTTLNTFPYKIAAVMIVSIVCLRVVVVW